MDSCALKILLFLLFNYFSNLIGLYAYGGYCHPGQYFFVFRQVQSAIVCISLIALAFEVK